MAKKAYVYNGNAWEDLASSISDLSSYATTVDLDDYQLKSVAGLTLINTTTFSAVTAVQVDNCFTSAYDNYRILLSITSCSGNNIAIRSRLVDGVTPDAGAAYGYLATGVQNNGGANNLSLLSQTSWQFAHGALGNPIAASIDVFAPNLATQTRMTFNSMNFNGSFALSYAGAGTGSSAQFEGIQFYPASGTFIGSMSIYGYGK